MDNFIELFADAIEKEDIVSQDDEFRKYDEWDSLAALAVLAMINEEFDITISRQDFDKLLTIKSLYDKIGEIKK